MNHFDLPTTMEEHPKAPKYIENNRGNRQLVDHENHLYHKDSGDERRL